MHLAVTGASGFIGPHLIEFLAAQGHTGVAISRRGQPVLPKGWELKSRAEVVKSGCCELKEFGATTPFDALVHLEVKQHVSNPTHADLQEFRSVNVEGTAHWLRWATERAVSRFVFFSTIKAVGDSIQCQDEITVGAPSTIYGQSKLAAENLVREWANAKPGRSALILRPAVVYGPGNTANLFSFVKAIARGRIFLVGNNDNIKSVISIRNLCAAVDHLLCRMSHGAEIFNLVDPRNYSVRELVAMIARALNMGWHERSIPLPVAQVVASAGDLFMRITHRDFPLTSSRLNALLETTHFSCVKLLETGFRHPQTTEEGLRELATWYRQSVSRAQPAN